MRVLLATLGLLLALGATPATAQDMAGVAWEMVRNSADPTVLNNFLRQFPDSDYADEAQEKLTALYDEGGTFEPKATPVPPPPKPAPPAPSRAVTFFVLLGAFSDPSAARREGRKLKGYDIDTEVLDTNDFDGMTPDLFVLSAGSYSSRDTAFTIADRMRAYVPDAYVKRATPRR